MLLYGLEVERFVSRNGVVVIPPADHRVPVDGFAAMVEFRSTPEPDLYACYGQIKSQEQKLFDNFGLVCENSLHAVRFTAKQVAEARRNQYAPAKDRITVVKNLYNKEPRLSPNGTALASVQINVSNRLSSSYTTPEGKLVPERFGLLDVQGIVSALDEEFDQEIKLSKRQRGMYALKDSVRLEYRSLPTSSFGPEFVKRVTSCLKAFS